MVSALANVLPGIRDLRAPLAAGYIWLLGLWLALEPTIPSRSQAGGVLGSVYELGDELSTVGLGIAASFVAYVVGALSTSLFATPSSGLRQTTRLSRLLRLEPFSAQALDALAALGRSTRTDLASILSMSGVDVDQLLDEIRVTTRTPTDDSWWAGRVRRAVRARGAGNRGTPSRARGPGSATARDFEAEQEERIARAVTRDLDTIATTRLLGRDQDLYSAVDRLRAEMEFRRAIAPPLAFAALVIAGREGGIWAVVVVAFVAVLTAGLFADAARLERRANDVLLDVLTDDRVQSPTLDRLRGRAVAITTRTPADELEQAASRLAAAIRRAIRRFEQIGTSEPALAGRAHADAQQAQALLDEVGPLLAPDVIDSAGAAVVLLQEMADLWMGAVQGKGGVDTDEVEVMLGRAQTEEQHFLARAKRQVALLRQAPATPST